MEYIEESKLLEGDEIFVATYNKDIREADNPMTEIYEEGEEAGLKKGIQQGIQQGIEQGLEKAMEDKQNEIVKNMYEQGLSLDIIAKVIKTSVNNVKKMLEFI